MKNFITLLIILCLIFTLARRIDAYGQSYLERSGAGAKSDIIYRVFGEFKNYLSDFSDMQTDLYFHGGIRDSHDEESAIMTPESADVHIQRGPHLEEREEKAAIPAANILLKTANALNITEHYHISGDREKELLPWIYYSVKLNPQNEKTYVIGGYWLGFRLNRVEDGVKFLKEGLSNNPGSWEINMMLGEIYLVLLKDYADAIAYLEKAKAIGNEKKIDKYNTRGIYTYLANAYENTGSPDRSITLYEELLRLFPGDRSIINKLTHFKDLESESKKQ